MRCRRSLYLAAALAMGVCPHARGLTFVFDNAAGMSQQAIDGFNEAARRWSANFTDNITVTIHTDFKSMSKGILGSTSYERRFVLYQSGPFNLRSKLVADAKSEDDALAISSLPNSGSSGINFLFNHTTTNNGDTYLDNNGSKNNSSFYITYANSRAMGLPTVAGSITNPDATISFSSDYAWDFNPSDGITSKSFDFVGMAMHEIGHVLGFVTEVDTLESNVTVQEDGTVVYNTVSENDYAYLTTLDLFRYSNSSEYGIVRDLSDENTRAKYFSIDGGTTAIAGFSTGENFGDGYQASHWKAGQGLGVMNPYLNYGTTALVSENDLRAMDVIGYDRDYVWSWDNLSAGSWNKAWNWDAYNIPNSSKITASFTTSGINPTVTLDSSATVKAISVGNDTVNLALSDNSLTVSEARIGDVVGKTAGLSLSGPGMLYADNVYVGGTSTASAGTGNLAVGSGATVSVSGTLKVYASTSNTVTISSGGAMNVQNVVNQGQFNASAGQLTVGGTFVNSGAATLGGTQIWAPGATLNNTGSLALLTDLGATGAKPVLILAGGTANIQAPQHLSALTLAGGNSKIVGINAISTDLFTATGGNLDLYQGGLIVNYSGDSAYSTVIAAIKSGCLTTSYSKDFPIAEAAFDNAYTHVDMWMGQPLDGYSQILTQYAYLGDVNLDGRVNEEDLLGVMANMNHTGTWLDGDMNYDGLINLADYNIVQTYIGAGATKPMFSMVQLSALPPSQLVVMVPEPGMLGLGAVGAIVALRRRRLKPAR